VRGNSYGISPWNKTFGCSDIDWANSVQQTGDGGYILGGYTDSFGAGSADVCIIKTYAKGNAPATPTPG